MKDGKKDDKHRKELRNMGFDPPSQPQPPERPVPPSAPPQPPVLEGRIIIGVSAKYADPPGEGKFGVKLLNITGDIPNEVGAIKQLLVAALNSLERLPAVRTAKKQK